MQDQKKGKSTGSSGSTTGGTAGTKARAGEQRSEEAGMRPQTSAMLRKGQGQSGMPGQGGQQGQMGRVTHGRDEQASEEAGMWQASAMLREAREEGDPEIQMREEDLHARQQNLGEREKSLRERDEQLRTREQGLRERQSKSWARAWVRPITKSIGPGTRGEQHGGREQEDPGDARVGYGRAEHEPDRDHDARRLEPTGWLPDRP